MKQLQCSGVLFAGAAVVLMAAQPVWAQATQVTAVQLSPTNRGFNVVLRTSTGNRPQIITSRQGNALVAYIINAQLRLPQKNNFRQDNPAPGIASVVITQTDPNSVRMVVTGTTSAPNSQITQRNAQGITLSVSRASGTATLPQLSPSVPSASANAPSPPPTAPRRGTSQSGQTTAQKPNVLVPNPEVTVDGKPVPATGTQPENQAPLPRAIAPPVGDIAVSNSDASASTINLDSTERVPRLVLRDAPVREVLALLARAAGLNLAFSAAAPAGQGQPDPNAGAGAGNEGPRISLDVEDESVQDVFNYVLRISGLQANRNGRTIFVSTRLNNQARDVVVRSFRLNQVTVGVALNFLVGFGAESAVSRERTITSVNAVPVGGSATPATQTQTSTETRIETQRIEFQDSVPLLRGLQALGDERTNSITLIGTPKQLDLATAQLIQLDSRRRQVAVNVKIVDVNLLALDQFSSSFSFGIGDSFFSSDGGAASFTFGGGNPPASTDVRESLSSPPVIENPFSGSVGFVDPNNPIAVPGTGVGTRIISPDGSITETPAGSAIFPGLSTGVPENPFQTGIIEVTPGTPNTTTFTTTPGTAGTAATFNPVTGELITPGTAGTAATTTVTATPGVVGTITTALPSLFQYPTRFLSSLQAQVTSGNAKILTDPTLIVQEGQQANVNLTQQVVGNITRTITDTTGGSRETLTVEKEQVGLTLSIRIERIDDNGFIGLSVAPVVRAPQAPAETPNGQIFLVSERSLNSGLVRLRDSQTLILSGIIQDQDRTTISKVPILGDIPILGALFRSTRRENTRQEVIVLLTPQILDDASSSFAGSNYTPGADARQILERRRQGSQVPGSNPINSPTANPSP